MNDWWKNPVLQGPENDYGAYDYLIEEIPHDSVKWELSKYKWRCDGCGKDSHLLLRAVSYFYTLDGYDYMDNTTCWRCHMKGKIWSVKHKIKRQIKILKAAWKFKRTCSNGDFKYWYDIAKRIN